MTSYRSRSVSKKYKKYLQNIAANGGDECGLCLVQPGDSQFIVQTEHFKVVHARFPYTMWDDHKVAEHIMIVPKAHIMRLSDLDKDQAHELMQLAAVYEKQGYNVYARATQSKGRTIPHQHTHLIKNVGPRHRLIFFIKRPLIRIVR